MIHVALQGVSAAPDSVVQRDSNTIKRFWNKDARSDPSHVQACEFLLSPFDMHSS